MPPQKKKINYANAMAEARELMWRHRWRLALGLVLMLISRSLGLVLPASTKFVIDEVIGKRRDGCYFGLVAGAAALATFLQAATSFALSQILGVAAQRAITEMRKRVQAQAHVERLPVTVLRFHEDRAGLISRIMAGAEGVRNLVGSGPGAVNRAGS